MDRDQLIRDQIIRGIVPVADIRAAEARFVAHAPIVAREQYEWEPGVPLNQRPSAGWERQPIISIKEPNVDDLCDCIHDPENGLLRHPWDECPSAFNPAFRWRPTDDNHGIRM